MYMGISVDSRIKKYIREEICKKLNLKDFSIRHGDELDILEFGFKEKEEK